MKNIMGLFGWLRGRGKTINRVILLALIIFDSYLAVLIYEPKSLIQTIEAWTKSTSSEIVNPQQPEQSPSPSVTVANPNATPTQGNEKKIEIESSATPQSSATPTTSPANNNSPTPSATTSPSIIPSATPSPTPNSSPIPSTVASPTPAPSVTTTTSPVYIQAYVYANNQQLVAEQYPVKVINNQTGETIATAETDHSGKSPTWQIAANTNVSIYLYPKSGTLGCGEVWTFTVGNLGTLETHNLSIQGERNPCITL